MTHKLVLDGETLDPQMAWSFSRAALNPGTQFKIEILPAALQRIQKASEYVTEVARGSKAVYGINTGFGKFAEVAISADKLDTLQRNLILSHACGVGPDLGRDITMAMWVLRLNTFCRGNSGVKPETVAAIIRCIEAGVLPIIPSRGSVGASGDLAPSAHATLLLIGEGEASIPDGKGFKKVAASEALAKVGIKALKLGPKEGLSLINGTQLTTALAIKTWSEGMNLVQHANLALAMSLEGLRASHSVFSEKILLARRHPGALACGQDVAEWIGGDTEISTSHADCGQVQDPYSLRCAPQVHGCVWDELQRATQVLKDEINSSTDNPLLFPEDQSSVSGGNFHAIFTARVSDTLAASLTVLGSISERRIALAMSPKSSRLPAFLTKDGGLNSGFMMAQVTAAALVSEAKALSHPASVDSIPTSDDREDHVSMGPAAGLKAVQIAENIRGVIAIELMSAAQALDLLAPLKSSARIQSALKMIRARVPTLENDRILSRDIESLSNLIQNQELTSL